MRDSFACNWSRHEDLTGAGIFAAYISTPTPTFTTPGLVSVIMSTITALRMAPHSNTDSRSSSKRLGGPRRAGKRAGHWS